jgi:hypothetical protein
MWFTYLKLNTTAGELTYDLAVDASGSGSPSLEDAGLIVPDDAGLIIPDDSTALPLWVLGGLLAALAAIVFVERRTAAHR